MCNKNLFTNFNARGFCVDVINESLQINFVRDQGMSFMRQNKNLHINMQLYINMPRKFRLEDCLKLPWIISSKSRANLLPWRVNGRPEWWNYSETTAKFHNGAVYARAMKISWSNYGVAEGKTLRKLRTSTKKTSQQNRWKHLRCMLEQPSDLRAVWLGKSSAMRFSTW